jgi:hypothetical protein
MTRTFGGLRPSDQSNHMVGGYDDKFKNAFCSFEIEKMLAMRDNISLRTTGRNGKLLVQCASTHISDRRLRLSLPGLSQQ